jgi:predicted nucleotidyltransferase
VTTSEIATIAATLAARDAAARLRASERTNARLAKLESAAMRLTRRGARHAWVFGSLARGDAREDSDVDLAVEGLPAAEYFAALAELMELFEGRVDLVRLEDAGESLRASVREEGKPLP